ncbi:MAG: flagellar hook protein FlgE [Burkholderiales bacterium]|nr:flagellar hook protein FlgE [Burkholderiales bacterium]
MGFQQGLSGLSAASKNLEVIGNNVANANTYGEKSSRAEFADMYAGAMSGASGNNIQAGIGVQVATVAQQFNQGNITPTGNPLDLAINGSGFFQTQDASNQTQYTRNGQFKVSSVGTIINDQGNKLLGYPADAAGNIVPGAAKPLQLPTGGIDPQQTTKSTMELNLDAREGVTTPASGPSIDFTNQKTYNNATSVTMYDAKGQDVAVSYYFQKTGTDAFDVYATANGTTVGGSPGSPAPVASLQFSSDGSSLISPSGPITLDIPASTNAAGATTLPITGIQLDVSGATEFGSNFGVTNMTQDGYTAGSLLGVSVDNNGKLIAQYSNGQTKAAGQVELATFRNDQGLSAIGGNAWKATNASGTPTVGVPGDGNFGVLNSGSLEESNVDLTAELVSMITAQRDYQANAQTIKTMDQAMQTLVNLR